MVPHNLNKAAGPAPVTNGDSETSLPSIRAVRYEDTAEEGEESSGLQVSPNNNTSRGSRYYRMTSSSEARTETRSSHALEILSTEQQSTSPRADNKTPKKDSPAFATKRRSISGSLNTLKQAGTKIRRGIQGVLPVTPGKKSDSALNKISSGDEKKVSNDRREDEVPFNTPERQPFDDLYDTTPPEQQTARSLAEAVTPSHGKQESNETERTFYDAKEAPTPANSLRAVNINTNGNSSQGQWPPRTSSRQANIIVQQQWPPRVSSLENAMTRINKRQSMISESDHLGHTALSSRRNSRLSFTSSHGRGGELGLQKNSDQATTDDSRPTSNELENSVSVTSAETERLEKAIHTRRPETQMRLFDLVKHYLRQPGDDIPTKINKPMKAVRVSTRGVIFKNAHKNFFPTWAAGVKRDGRRYTQKEVVDIVMNSM